jgi:two-component system sensor histidine kinase/response regulator
MVEDSDNDAALVLRELQKAGYAIESKRVENAAQMQTALVEHDWDIITADFSLPNFDAPSALAVLQKNGLDIPFIVISGAISEENALSLMRAGAQDYLMKDSLGRLIPVLEREFVQARKRRDHREAEHALRKSEERFRTLIEQASDGIFTADPSGNFLDANPSGLAMLGYNREELLKLNLNKMAPASDLTQEPIHFEEMRAGKIITVQRRILRKDGSIFVAEISGKILPDGRMQGIVRDITERKLADDELRRLNRVYALTSQVSQMVVRTRVPLELFNNICRIVIEEGKFRMAWVGLVGESRQAVRPVAWYGDERGYLALIKEISISEKSDGCGPKGKAIRAGQPFICNDIANDPNMQQGREPALERGYRAAIALPIMVHGVLVGSFNLYSAEPFIFNEAEVGLLQDVTGDLAYALEMIENEARRIQAEDRLHNTLLQLNFHIENSPLAVIHFDNEYRITGWSGRAREMFGWTAEEVLGKRSDELPWFHELDAHWAAAARAEMLATHRTSTVHTIRNYDKNGALLICQWYNSALLDAGGQMVSLQSRVLDISERARAEEALRESERKFRLLVEQSPTGIMILNHQGMIIGWNHAQESIYGLQANQAIGHYGWEIQPLFLPELANSPERAEKLKHTILESLASGRSLSLNRVKESQITRADGTRRWVETIAFVISTVDGYISVTITNDISERKKAEETLHLQSAALENAANAITITNREGTIQWINPAWTELTGYSADEVLGKNPRILNSGQQNQDYYKNLWSTILRGDVWRGELVNRRKDGSLYTEEEIITPVHDEKGEISHFVAIKQDITERKRAEADLLQAHAELEQRVQERTADLRVANLELEKAARMKDEFLASMSHELRTPLTGILGLAEAMQMVTYGELNDKQRRALKNIETSGRHLLLLINEILDLSKIESGRFDLQIEACSLGDICNSSLQLTRGMANQKHQNVRFEMSPAAIFLRADARRLKQMLVNLLGNAIKFTPEGGNLGIEVLGRQADEELRISVWDEGIGIRDEDLPRLFEPFVQLDSSLSRQYAGTGLGLSLVQRLAELHQGRVEVASNFGKGSRFTIVLPWPVASALTALQDRKTTPVTGALRLKDNALIPGPYVLMADDNETALELVRDYLTSRNYRVGCAMSGAEFLAKLEDAPVEMVLMDIQMPVMDGIEVIRRIRSHRDKRIAGLPVIAVTALAMPGDRERCLAAGANAYMSKPIRLKELVGTIERLLGISTT